VVRPRAIERPLSEEYYYGAYRQHGHAT